MHIEETNQSPAERLGAKLRQARERQGLSTHVIAKRAGLNQSQVLRIEHGAYATPDPAKVAAIADALDLDLTEAMASARYPLQAEALSPTLYLRAKYRDLPAAQLADLQREVAHVLQRHGIEANDGPAPGEDEAPDQASPSSNPQKGGSP